MTYYDIGSTTPKMTDLAMFLRNTQNVWSSGIWCFFFPCFCSRVQDTHMHTHNTGRERSVYAGGFRDYHFFHSSGTGSWWGDGRHNMSLNCFEKNWNPSYLFSLKLLYIDFFKKMKNSVFGKPLRTWYLKCFSGFIQGKTDKDATNKIWGAWG